MPQSTLSTKNEPITHASRHVPNLDAFCGLDLCPLYLFGTAWAQIAIWIFAPQRLTGSLLGTAWHAHEMLCGFVATIAVGLLMTAGTNWSGINPLHGVALSATIADARFLSIRSHTSGYGHIDRQIGVLVEQRGMSVVSTGIEAEIALGHAREMLSLDGLRCTAYMVSLDVSQTPEAPNMIAAPSKLREAVSSIQRGSVKRLSRSIRGTRPGKGSAAGTLLPFGERLTQPQP